MGQLTCKIVRPDRLMYEGPAASVVLVMVCPFTYASFVALS